MLHQIDLMPRFVLAGLSGSSGLREAAGSGALGPRWNGMRRDERIASMLRKMTAVSLSHEQRVHSARGSHKAPELFGGD